jgi:DNA-binding transcriptional ArsR family regulator
LRACWSARSSCRLLLLGVVCLSLLTPVAHAREDFAVTVTSDSTAVVSGADDLDARGLFLSVRNTTANLSMIGLAGNVTSARIDRFESSVTLYEDNENYFTGVRSKPSITSVAEGNFLFRLNKANEFAAVVLYAARFQGTHSRQNLTIIGPVSNPHAVPIGGKVAYGPPPNANESGGWEERGSFLAYEPSSIAGSGSGRLRLYWFQTSIVIQVGTETKQLESRVWDEPIVGNTGNGVLVRHFVWHELTAPSSSFLLSTPRASRATMIACAQELRAFGIDSLSFDSAESVQGALPTSSGGSAPSLWIQGNMTVFGAFEQGGSASDPKYALVITGRAQSYSYGGGPPEVVSSTVQAVTLAAAAVVAFGLVFFRELIFEGLGRISLCLHSKLGVGSLLANPKRDLLYQAVFSTPGISYLGLLHVLRGEESRRSGLGTLTHHLSTLEKFGIIASQRVGRHRRYWVRAQTNSTAVIAAALSRSGPRKAILSSLRTNPGRTASELHAEIHREEPLTLQGVLYHLRRLEKAGIVQFEVTRRRRQYRIADAGTVRELLPGDSKFA